MDIIKLTCSNCGAAQLTDEGAGKFSCEYCGVTYLVDLDPRTGELEDAIISGSMQDAAQVYAVHGKLIVSGSMNDVNLLNKAKDAFHVRNLVVSGSMNDVEAVLLDGATVHVSGSMNDINRPKR